MIRFICFISVLFCLGSCTTKEPFTPTYISLEYPQHFPKPHLPERNLQTEEGIALGERLFFDTSLSKNGKVSCATCHNPLLSFSDGVALSDFGVSGKKMKRNTPALINLLWMDGLFWDGGVHNLESLPFAALTNPDEMGSDLFDISKKLNRDDTYRKQFKKAFGIDSISSAYIARALAQYQRTLIFANSKYDQSQKGEIALPKKENMGFQVFKKKCSGCHIPPLFTDNNYHNNGLDSIFPSGNLDVLKGRYRISLDSSDMGKYKTPTLRNLNYTAPYMHDGRFATLEEVLNHYQSGIIPTSSVDNELIDFSLTNGEKELLLNFLDALNNESLHGHF